MLKLAELNKWYDDLNSIIFDIKISIDNIKRLTNAQNEEEKQILNHGFFSHLYRQSRFTIIVQLCKIFADNDNQKRNLYKLFNRFHSEKYCNDLMKQLENNSTSEHLFSKRSDILREVEILLSEIEKRKSIIDRVIILRDKFYAHKDPDSTLQNVSNEELEVLVDLAVKIYNSMRGKLFDITFFFDMNSEWKVDYPIKVIAENRKEQLEKIKNKTKSNIGS